MCVLVGDNVTHDCKQASVFGTRLSPGRERGFRHWASSIAKHKRLT